jgi:uncharacterized membrane protein
METTVIEPGNVLIIWQIVSVVVILLLAIVAFKIYKYVKSNK